MSDSNNVKQTTLPAMALGPYSPVRQIGSTYYTAGHTGFNAATGAAEPDVISQTKQALENLTATLASVGLTLNHVVKTTLFVTDMGDFAAVNEVYLSYFDEPRPARSTVAVKELPRVAKDVPLKIEIEAIASSAEAQEK